MTTQPQLLDIALDSQDVVYTPDWVASDMVEYFKPSERILEPCKGDGAFMKYLPAADWCEIEEGRDFFKYTNAVDWCFGNPPYKIFSEWLDHSMEIAKNIVYLLPMNKPFNSIYMYKKIYKWGGIVAIRAYGHGSLFGLNLGFAIGAIHFKKDYKGTINPSIYEAGD
jgi:hypothetical protein